ncbi:hypothetical protein FOZ63_004230 [Perkinsus olseni]|uniref:Uncharacterized protein n=1 Tax=Perkinsus olseni TaxID=32597 RepID=A0A7J6Q7R5_PEROL|nr:hypothetical protein FOZ63_004230 [Perkinsus olseni]
MVENMVCDVSRPITRMSREINEMQNCILRIRVNASSVKNMTDIEEYVLKAWPQLGRLYENYRLYYTDDSDEKCLLNDLSLEDGLTLARIRAEASGRIPLLELNIEEMDDGNSATPCEKADSEIGDADTLAELLEDLGYVVSSVGADALVESLGETGVDLARLREQLEFEKKNGGQEELPKDPVEGLPIEKMESGDEDARRTMVDLLTQLGFVDNRETAEDLVERLGSSSKDINKVSRRLIDLAKEQEEERTGEATEEPLKEANDEELCVAETSDVANQLQRLLIEKHFVRTPEGAEDLVAALVGADQDLKKVLQHFTDKMTTKGFQSISSRRYSHGGTGRKGSSGKAPTYSS